MEYVSQNNKNRLVVAFITYGESSLKYLPFFLDSLYKQSFKSFSVIALDNSQNYSLNREYLVENYPNIKLIRSERNVGFARAYNKMIARAIEEGAEYFLALNPDIILESDSFDIMISRIEEDKKLGSLSPKIFSWNFEKNEKTNIIDTCGIALEKGLRFVDIGQGKKKVSGNELEKILGPSGAIALYRTEALKKIAVAGKYFDENMFMYKEDCDLAYRLFLAGYESTCADEAIAYHDRTTKSLGGGIDIFKTRANKNIKTKEWSFLNQHIIYLKFWSRQGLINKFFILFHVLKMFVYIMLFESFLLKQYLVLFRLKKNIKFYKQRI